MLIASVAYNIVQALKELALPVEIELSTLCFKLFHVAGRITKHARRLWLHLFSTNVSEVYTDRLYLESRILNQQVIKKSNFKIFQ